VIERRQTNRIIVHHSLSSRKWTTKADLHRWHVTEKGWEDIGYHYFIDGDGICYACRKLNLKGAHAFGRNHDSIGICLAGDFSKETPSYWQMRTLRHLADAINLVLDTYLDIEFHRSTKNKCPGKFFHRLELFHAQ